MRDPHNGPGIGENETRPKPVEVGETSAGGVFGFPSGTSTAADSCGTDQGHRSIRIFPDVVLLEIFDLCRTDRECHYSRRNQQATIFEWQLAHVCQRWRYLIFASPSRLDLELLCSAGTPVRKDLGYWPAFPIVIEYHKVAPEDEDNLVAALEHPDRVRRVTVFGVARHLWGKMDAAMQRPFPDLTHLWLTGPGPKDLDQRAVLRSGSLLGGGALRLVELYLSGISFPALPKFLLSASELVHLHFLEIPPTCYISPEAMVTGLAGLTRLKTLAIEFLYAILLPHHQDQRIPAPATPVVSLPALDAFRFKGFSEYLEDLVARIDAPRVASFNIHYFSQPVYQVPQLSRFLRRRSEYIMPSLAQVRFVPWVNMMFSGRSQDGERGGRVNLSLLFSTSGMVRGVLHSIQVLQQISSSLSGIIDLSFDGPAPPSDEPLYGGSRFGSLFGGTLSGIPLLELPGVPDSIDPIDWIELLRPFTGVDTLRLRGELVDCVIRALEWLREDMATQILPALRSLHFADLPSISVERFVSQRQNAGRPVTINPPEEEDEDNEDNGDEDEDSEDEDEDEFSE
jgi:hypothetical protein